jgi:hypothetical protein
MTTPGSTLTEDLWRRAAAELSVRATIPFNLRADNREMWVTAFLPDFGGPRGTAVVAVTSYDESIYPLLYHTAAAHGTFASLMVVPEIYDAEVFRDALVDWGYYGPVENRPKWLNGEIVKYWENDPHFRALAPEEAVTRCHRIGLSPAETTFLLMRVQRLSVDKAKQTLMDHPAWSAERAGLERFPQELIDATQKLLSREKKNSK